MPTSIVYTDQGPALDGSALAADTLNTAVVAQAYLLWGGVLPSTATGSPSSSVPGLDLPMPETAAVVVVPNPLDSTLPPQTIYVRVPVTTLPFQFNSDNYVDLYASENGPTSTGTYIVRAVAIAATAPAQDAQALRLCLVRMGPSGITSVSQLATPCPVSQSMVTVDATEAATYDTVAATSTLLANLDRMRYQLGAIYARVPGGGEWLGTGTIEAWNTSTPALLHPMVPWEMRGMANGVAELDATGRLPNGELPINPDIAGNLTVEGSETVGGNLAVGGAISAGGTISSTSTGTSVFAGPISCPSIVVGAGGLVDNGPATFNDGVNIPAGGLAVTGTTTFNSPATFSSGLAANALATFNAGIDITAGGLGVTGTTTFASPATFNGGQASNGLATFNSGVDITSGGLGVTGASTFASLVTFNGGQTSNGLATFNSGVNISSGGLGVTGASTFVSAVTMSGGATVNNVLTCTSAIHLSGTIEPDGVSLTAAANLGFLAGAGGGSSLDFVGTHHTDIAGEVVYTNTSATSGPQFQVLFSGPPRVHNADPMVLLTARGGGTQGAWYVSSVDQTQFSVATAFTMTAGATYYITYWVVN